MNLKNHLKHNRLSATEFARNCGLSLSLISKISNGKRPSPESAAIIERATDGAVTRLELLYPRRKGG